MELNRRGFFGRLAAVAAGAMAVAMGKPKRSNGCLSMRYVQQYGIVTDQVPQRMDVWYSGSGAAELRERYTIPAGQHLAGQFNAAIERLNA